MARRRDDDDYDDDFDDEENDDAPRRSRRRSSGGDSTGGLIPYKNPSALIAYYCGLFSLFPLLGFFLGLAGVILGIKGLRHRAQHPETHGLIHALIGIVMGGIFTVVWGLMIIGIIIAIIAEAGKH